MDALKLLSRSTSLQKSLSEKRSSSSANIPSAGAAPHPQLSTLGADSVDKRRGSASDQEKRGKKRKRTHAEVLAPDECDVPNFFAQLQEKEPDQIQLRLEDKETTLKGINDEPTEVVGRREEDECKKILKFHKLKVTVMSTSPEANQLRKVKKNKNEGKATAFGSEGKTILTQIYPQPLESFTELRSRYSISKRLFQNLDAQGYALPTEVQLGSLPLLLGTDEDRGLGVSKKKLPRRSNVDLLTIAPTGSGKTLAFLIPVIQGILRNRKEDEEASRGSKEERDVKAIVLAPTHELMDQIVNEARKLTAGTGVKVSGMQKGMHVFQREYTKDTSGSNLPQTIKTDIVVSTPLMLLHAISSDSDSSRQKLSSIRYLVFDEADVLLDPLFREQCLGIWDACTNSALNISFWSATIGSSIESLVQSKIFKRRKALGLPSKNHRLVRIIVGLKDSALPNVSHRLVYTGSEQGKLLALRQLLHPTTADLSDGSTALRPPFLVFTQTISRAIALHSELLYDIPLEAGGSARMAVLHSDLSESARSNIMAEFRKGEIWILITTDLLSRGIDFRGINGVVNYDIPNTGATYVHRAGRTGRAGREGGIAVTLYTKEDIPYVKNVANVIAASEKAYGKKPTNNGTGVQKWLLDALPSVSKQTRQELKKKGVAARRTVKGEGSHGKESRAMRISTKSGFERKLENRRKGAIEGSRQRSSNDNQIESGGEDEEWGGIED